VDNYNYSQNAAFNFLKDLVDKLYDTDKPPNTLDNLIRYAGYFYLIGYESKLYGEFVRDRKSGKEKRKLEYYDAMPLVFVIQVDKKGFTAVNFHWMHSKARAMILQRIITAFPTKFFNDEIIRPMTWTIFSNMIGPYRKKYLKMAVRRYLWSQMKRVKGWKIVRIPNNEMINAINYTSAMWVGINERKVRQMQYKIITEAAVKNQLRRGATKFLSSVRR
jgi:hypothetical protein